MLEHPNFSSTTFANDIALLQLESPAAFNALIQPVCLPNGKVESTGAKGVITGWGKTVETSSSISDILQQATITVQSSTVCGNNNTATICAGEYLLTIVDRCAGDNGGPFVVKVGDCYLKKTEHQIHYNFVTYYLNFVPCLELRDSNSKIVTDSNSK